MTGSVNPEIFQGLGIMVQSITAAAEPVNNLHMHAAEAA